MIVVVVVEVVVPFVAILIVAILVIVDGSICQVVGSLFACKLACLLLLLVS